MDRATLSFLKPFLKLCYVQIILVYFFLGSSESDMRLFIATLAKVELACLTVVVGKTLRTDTALDTMFFSGHALKPAVHLLAWWV